MTFPNIRDEQIEFILSKLGKLHPQSETEKYAIAENILFFKSIRSISGYINWLYRLRKQVRAQDLLEINELLPELDDVFHAKMAEIERRPRPGIIRPAVDYITELVTNASSNKRFRVASLGSGSMEVERQSIERVQQTLNTRSLTIIGFDISPNTRAFAGRNLNVLTNVRIVQESKLTERRLVEIEQETSESTLIVVSDNDIFKLSADFSSNAFNLVMTTLLLHHLQEAERTRLVRNMRVLAPYVMNYDGYQNEIVVPLLSLTGWGSPVFLNSAVFSTIRFPTRAEVLGLHEGAQITFYNHGHYRATFSA
ncbi:MAG: class I SAM-dependent methyltransferase [Candidatus Paceibacterota bacterium]|jgi:hypothetical protein